MPRVEVIHTEVQRLLRAVPFHRFALSMENGDLVVIEHPENIAFDPGPGPNAKASEDFYVISNNLRLFSTFAAVTSVGLVDHGELAS
jgi:hypothetical protein